MTSLPIGFRIVLDRHTSVLNGGKVLLGGAPTTRLLRLTPRAQALMDGRTLIVRDQAGAVLADRLLELGLAHPVVRELPLPDDRDLTYVVPIRDRAAQLDRLLDSIAPGSRVIVVDDASINPEPVASVAARHAADLVVLPRNLGPAGARNAGLALVRTPFVVFVDSDIVLDKDTMPTLLRHFADPQVGLAVPRITGLDAPGSDSWIGRYEQAHSSLDLGAHPALVRPGSFVSWASTACLVVRVEALDGGFDERMRVGEDVDLGWRAIAGGWRLRYEPSVAAAHEHRAEFVDWFRRKAEYGTGAEPLAVRHPRSVAPAVFAPWSAAMVLALLSQRRWSVPVAAAITGVAAVRITQRLGDIDQPLHTGARLTGNGAVTALAQSGALLTRHWWPATAIACLVSRRARRAAALAAVADVAMEYRGSSADLDPLRYAAARRLDDLAYGAGVWWSALRGRSITPLLPRIQSPSTRRANPASSSSVKSAPSSCSHS